MTLNTHKSSTTDTDPAPVLPALHRLQDETGRISADSLIQLSEQLGLPVADLTSAASFYHYFSTQAADGEHKGRCQGPTCSLHDQAGMGDHGIACPGLCDQPTAELEDGVFQTNTGPADPYLVPVYTSESTVIFDRYAGSGTERMEDYVSAGGYDQLLQVVKGGDAERWLGLLKDSGLVGRGGAAFPLAVKWQAVRAAEAPDKFVVCNADEGEPGTFKDRAILHLRPHLLLEAMAIAGALVGAKTGIIYLRYEYPEAYRLLTEAIREAETAHMLGDHIGGTELEFHIHLRRGAGSYVCGEETALLNSLEGRRPWPRERPPYPTTNGLWGQPTIINNVETFASVPAILRHGVDWYRGLGAGESPGTKLYSISGRVQHPGNYELPLGVTARQLIFGHAGGPPEGHSVKAFTIGGISGGFLGAEHLDLPLDYSAPAKMGTFLGSGGVVVLDDTNCPVEFARTCLAFYATESCGKCFPCRIGTVRLHEFLDALTGRGTGQLSMDEIQEISQAMMRTSACGLGQSAPLVLRGLLESFADEVAEHVNDHVCRAGVCHW